MLVFQVHGRTGNLILICEACFSQLIRVEVEKYHLNEAAVLLEHVRIILVGDVQLDFFENILKSEGAAHQVEKVAEDVVREILPEDDPTLIHELVKEVVHVVAVQYG